MEVRVQKSTVQTSNMELRLLEKEYKAETDPAQNSFFEGVLQLGFPNQVQ